MEIWGRLVVFARYKPDGILVPGYTRLLPVVPRKSFFSLETSGIGEGVVDTSIAAAPISSAKNSRGTLNAQRGAPPKVLRRGVEWLVIVAVALLVAFVVKTFVFQAFYIPSGSMEPTLMIGDRILVDKLSYDLHPVHRFDIVVFSNPMRNDPSIKDLVKRVIGLPGDTISSNAQGDVLINGKVIPEPFLRPGISMGPPIHTQTVKPGYMFVMGDNRGDSEDSRYFGQVRQSSIVGRVVLRVWPLSAIHFF